MNGAREEAGRLMDDLVPFSQLPEEVIFWK
jgi:hypothetical protein